MALTKKKIDSFKYDGRTMDFRPDGSDGIPNFGIRLYKSGIKSFVLGYRLPGIRRQQWITIGKYGVITLKQAQERAQELLWDIARGIDPKAQSTEAQTLAEFSEDFTDSETHRLSMRWSVGFANTSSLPSERKT